MPRVVDRQRAGKEIVGTEKDRMGDCVTFLAPSEGGGSLWVMGELVARKISSRRTGGAYSLFEVRTPPGVSPSAHVQHRADEAFYVLEGEYEFSIEGRILPSPAGSLLYVPKGNLRAHRNVGEGTGRMLVCHTPGGPYEGFFEDVGVEDVNRRALPASERPEDLARAIGEIAAGYGIEISPAEEQTRAKESR
jgi:mannose-6-phosphate isomerase-like protein (cupin superfamily)